MNNKFDELAKGMAQSVTRRQALKKFGVSLAGMALACFGLANAARAASKCVPGGAECEPGGPRCCKGYVCRQPPDGQLLFCVRYQHVH